MFIFNNPGIQHCMTDFWAKVHEIYWSGGMSPGLAENEKHGLICALQHSSYYLIQINTTLKLLSHTDKYNNIMSFVTNLQIVPLC